MQMSALFLFRKAGSHSSGTLRWQHKGLLLSYGNRSFSWTGSWHITQWPSKGPSSSMSASVASLSRGWGQGGSMAVLEIRQVKSTCLID